jgi:hypothetical protein
MPQGTRQPIQAPHHERIAGLEIGPAGEKAGAIFAGSGRLVLVEMARFHTGRPQGVQLEVKPLIFGRRPGIANQFSHSSVLLAEWCVHQTSLVVE